MSSPAACRATTLPVGRGPRETDDVGRVDHSSADLGTGAGDHRPQRCGNPGIDERAPRGQDAERPWLSAFWITALPVASAGTTSMRRARRGSSTA